MIIIITNLERSRQTSLLAQLVEREQYPVFAHLGVLPADPDPRVEAGSVVSLHDVSPEHTASAHPAVVWTLRPGESALGPAQWVT